MAEIVASMLVLAAMAAATISLSGQAYWTDFSPGPAFLPYWIAGLGSLIAILLILQTVRSRFAHAEETDFSDLDRAGSVALLLVALLVVMPWVGMLLGSCALVLVMLIGLQRRPVLPSLLATAVTAAIVYGVFDAWLQVDLPRSPFGI